MKELPPHSQFARMKNIPIFAQQNEFGKGD